MTTSVDALGRLVEARLGIDLSRAGLKEALKQYLARSEGAKESPDRWDVNGEEFQRLVDVVTVQHSWLFRDAQQLEAAVTALRQVPGGHRRQIWVPACATGEDVFSIASLCAAQALDVDVLGSDIHAGAVEIAKNAHYGPFARRAIPPPYLGMLDGAGTLRPINPALRGMTRFEVHNLLGPPPRSGRADGKWELIVCRNVLFYFTRARSAEVLRQFALALAPDGILVLGASDILAEVPVGMRALEVGGRVVFRCGAGPETLPLPAPDWASQAARGRELERQARELRTRGVPPTPTPSPVMTSARASAPAHRLPSAAPERSPRGISERAAPEAEERVLHEDVVQAVTYLTDGIAQYLAGELDQAVTKLRAALYLAPNLWPASYYLALSFDDLGQGETARREYAHVNRCIEKASPLPPIDGHDFSFLSRDIAAIARRRARS